jgi:hypothetical protein
MTWATNRLAEAVGPLVLGWGVFRSWVIGAAPGNLAYRARTALYRERWGSGAPAQQNNPAGLGRKVPAIVTDVRKHATGIHQKARTLGLYARRDSRRKKLPCAT